MTQQNFSCAYNSFIHKLSKPFILHHLSIQKSTPNTRFYKHIHSLQLSSSLDLNFRTAHIKTLNSLDLTLSPNKPPPLHIRRIQKFVKPRRKSIKSLTGNFNKLPVQKLLPRLSQVILDYNDHNLRLLGTNSQSPALFIDFSEFRNAPRRNILIKKLSTDPQNTFFKPISRMRNLRTINLHLDGWHPEHNFLIFKLFDRLDLSRLPPLQHFSLKITSTYDGYWQTPKEKDPEKIRALQYLTELRVLDSRWFYSLFDEDLCENLLVLQVKLFSAFVSYRDDLSAFKRLKKLKKLDLTYRAHEVKVEGQFLESLTLPSSLETIHLTLMDFRWIPEELTKKNRRILQAEFYSEQRFLLFFGQWKELKNLKNLSITIKEELSSSLKRCPGIAGNFASRIIRQLKSLENVCYTHIISLEDNIKASPGAFVKPLSLEELWKALESSKKTLESLVIEAPEVAFPLAMKSLDRQFPCLKRISLGKKILWVKDLTAIWSGLRRLEEIKMEGVRFYEEEKLERFLESLIKDLKVENVNFGINLEGLRGEFLMHCLNMLVEKIGIQKGNVKLTFQNIEIKETEGDFVKFCERARLKKFRVDMTQENTLVLRSGKSIF